MRRLAALLLFLLIAGAAGGQPMTAGERIGARIYHEGIDRTGRPIEARVAGSATPLKGKAMSCGNCHGEDGRGRPESGVDPGDVTWTHLSKPYGHVRANNRRHGPYNRANFIRAMRDGLDPAGNVLEPAMPRYALDDADMEALLAYLKRLDHRADPGIADATLAIGTALPTTGRLAAAGHAVQRVLQGYLDGVNARGGVHGRRLHLVVAPLGDDPASAGAAIERLLAQDTVLALLAPLTAGAERAATDAVEKARAPLVGPLTLYPEGRAASSLYVFHLLPGVPELADALAAHLHPVLALNGRPVVLLHAPTDDGKAIAQAVEERLRARGYSALAAEPAGAPAAVAARLKERDAHAVVALSGSGLTALAKATADAGLRSYWLVPAPFVPPDVLAWPTALDGRVLLAYPSLPADRTAAGEAMLDSLGGGERGHRAMQVAALGAAMVLVEGLSRAGRDLSRQKLIAALEGLHGFETGLTPRISYGPDRRIGSYGAYAVTVDLAGGAFRPLPDFIRLQ